MLAIYMRHIEVSLLPTGIELPRVGLPRYDDWLVNRNLCALGRIQMKTGRTASLVAHLFSPHPRTQCGLQTAYSISLNNYLAWSCCLAFAVFHALRQAIHGMTRRSIVAHKPTGAATSDKNASQRSVPRLPRQLGAPMAQCHVVHVTAHAACSLSLLRRR